MVEEMCMSVPVLRERTIRSMKPSGKSAGCDASRMGSIDVLTCLLPYVYGFTLRAACGPILKAS